MTSCDNLFLVTPTGVNSSVNTEVPSVTQAVNGGAGPGASWLEPTDKESLCMARGLRYEKRKVRKRFLTGISLRTFLVMRRKNDHQVW